MAFDKEHPPDWLQPAMSISDGNSETSLCRAPPPLSRDLSAEARASARFHVSGNVIVVGGAGALGFATAQALLEHGASGCCIWDLQFMLDGCRQEINQLTNQFPSAAISCIPVDIENADSISSGMQTSLDRLGTIRHMLYFAGITGSDHALSIEQSSWQKVMDVNMTGAYLCTQTAARHMVEQETGGCSITLTASISAHSVNYPQPQVGYNASKAAILSMKSSLAAEWAVHGIRVNSVSPGYMDTRLNAGGGRMQALREIWACRNPMGRMGSPEELTPAYVLLTSDGGTYINGADLVVDGGGHVF